MTTAVVPREAMAAAARSFAEQHDQWDAPHHFITLHWDGEQISYGTVVVILPDVNPRDYAAYMAKAAYEQARSEPARPPCGYLLQVEAYGMTEPAPDAPREERRRYERAARERTFHEQPDRVESVAVWVADIHGRLWAASELRSRPGEVSESFYRPGNAPGDSSPLIAALLAVAEAAGQVVRS